MAEPQILVLDFGGQYAHLIARRVRELGVYAEIRDSDSPLSAFSRAKGIILSGGPRSVFEKKAPPYNPGIFKLGLPILGICYGHQLMGKEMLGRVVPGETKEYGKAEVRMESRKGIFAGLGKLESVWMNHGDIVKKLPPLFTLAGSTEDCPISAMHCLEKKMFGVQFHPEVRHTRSGMKILGEFVFTQCGCEKNWSLENFLELKKVQLKEQVGEKKVLVLASGGIDSTVALTLLSKALPPRQVFALHVDTGFMREGESQAVARFLKRLHVNVRVAHAQKAFFSGLKDAYSAEEKRKIIGRVFLEVKREELKKLKIRAEDWLLCQGTIYPDTIESKGTRHASRIKTHHNRVKEILDLIAQGRLVEPLTELYKDEVRELGKKLGLPRELIERHPFPGPGLAIRVLCSRKRGKISIKNNKNLDRFLARHPFYGILLPLKSVGIQGDARTYRSPVLLQGPLDWDAAEKASTRLTNAYRKANRVVLSVLPRKIESLEIVPAGLTPARTALARRADALVMKEIHRTGLYSRIWQFPVVLLPLRVNGQGETVVLRPVESTEAMTANFYRMPGKALGEMAERLLKIKGIGAVFYDVTHKPPGTIEWE